ncbi:uncharacterized protein K460DRAFT_247010, partial [Cucurbitaria berberidis CBS 394.84]
RHDTSSSTGSAKALPQGHWELELSGNCPSCHHHHKSTKVHVRASGDSNHVCDMGEIYCEKCKRLWLDFGRRNSTRLSLVSVKTIEPDPLEKDFHSTLVKMIRPITTVATLSPTLADIPESSSASPSREPSLRSNSRRGIRVTSPSIASNAITEHHSAADANSLTFPSAQKTKASLGRAHAARTSFLSQVSSRIRDKFPLLKTSRLTTWMKSSQGDKLSPNRRGKLPVSEPGFSPVIPALHAPVTGSVEAQVHTGPTAKKEPDVVDVFTPSTTAVEALESLKILDHEEIRAMNREQRINWMRGKLTAFKRDAMPFHPSSVPIMVDLQPDPSTPPTRHDSELAFVGNNFGSFHYWETFRGSNATLNGWPPSMSEPPLSEADTARDRHGSSSTRPRSFQGVVQDWQQIRQNRAEARRSFDSAATGGAVRSITAARGRGPNRLSRTSMGRPEPFVSQVQLPLHEESEQPSGQEQIRSSSPSLP